MSETDFQTEQKLNELIANWNDGNLENARKFAQSHKILMTGKDFGKAQLYGLLNIVRNIKNVEEIKNFIKHQADKAIRAGKGKERHAIFWNDLQNRREKIQEDAEKIARLISVSGTHFASVYRRLLAKYTLHILAEKLMMELEIPKDHKDNRKERRQ